MIQLKGVEMSFGVQVLYREVDASIDERDRIGLVGPNGSGKTTLLKLIQGVVQPEKGEIKRKRGISIAYLPQTKVVLEDRSVLEETLSAFTRVARVAEEMRKLEKAMQKRRGVGSALKRYAELQETYERYGYACEAKAKRILARLGFRNEDLSKTTATQSGGFQMRIALAKLLLQEPDVLLLDEPTNYLDIQSIEGFETYLKDFRGSFVLIAHDRRLLDGCAEKVWSIENQRLTIYKGNYSFFVEESQRRRLALEKLQKEQRREVQKTRKFIEKFRAKASTARRAKSRERMLSKREPIAAPKRPKSIHFQFEEADRIYGKVIELKDISKTYDGREIFEHVNLIVQHGERVAIFGANGEGKTTLLRIMCGWLKPSCGQIWRSGKLKIAFYSQGAEEELEEDRTIFDEIAKPAEAYGASELRNILGGFLFTGDDIYKPIRVLSGGERTRLAILKVLLTPSNLLVLDEPANHLDIRSREILEEAISVYRHTVIFAAHDRYMIDRLATKSLRIEGGRARLYMGNYSYAVQDHDESGRVTKPVRVKSRIADTDELEAQRNRLRELEEEYRTAKEMRELNRARELWEEYRMVQREIERIEAFKKPSQDGADSG